MNKYSKEITMADQYVNDIFDELSMFISQDGIQDDEKIWAANHVDDPQLKEIIAHLSTTDIKVMVQLAWDDSYHAKQLPSLTGVSQATVSRVLTKLEKYDVAYKYRDTKNNKEVLVRLTDKGRELAVVHTKLDQALLKQAQEVMQKYSRDDLAKFVSMLHDIRQIRAK
ncbi:transcription regulator [Paucilactobacillus suebicus DSM 5007 = KCTC 3549]|uniref:Transcription regulator n=2 Tax=Paucilactobacillus suebicus TaxID=152335 RepID=A0A0R1W1R5_9LACO|nr:transcription regulator [Paucilactobacillus suebicus DSM 5007 = KCTC 3549]